MSECNDPKPEPASQSVKAEITRRAFVSCGGGLFVTLAMLPRSSASPVEIQPAPTPIASWIEIRSDSSVLVRTGRTEIGTGMSGFYARSLPRIGGPPESVDYGRHGGHRTAATSAGFLAGAANLHKSVRIHLSGTT